MISLSKIYQEVCAATPFYQGGGLQAHEIKEAHWQLQLWQSPKEAWAYAALSCSEGLDLHAADWQVYRLQGDVVCWQSPQGYYCLLAQTPHHLKVDAHQRLQTCVPQALSWQRATDQWQASIRPEAEEQTHLTLLFTYEAEAVAEWFAQSELENTVFTVEGSWSETQAPGGLLDYCFWGQIYSKRFAHFGRFPSGQDAFSLFRISALLLHHTGKSFYRFWMRLSAANLHYRQNKAGVWPNGEWLEHPEVHTRFNIDGARLLNQAAALFNEPRWRQAAHKNLAYFAQKADTLNGDSLWFLHDACEFDPQAFKVKQKRALLHQAFGKKPHNALVLNTHLQTLLLIAEMQDQSTHPELAQWEQKGLQAAQKVLAARLAPLRYALGDWFLRQVLSIEKASLPIRILRRYGFKHLFKLYRLQKNVRLVSPAGFLYRDAALPLFGYWYHFVNIYDLQQLVHYRPQPYLQEALQQGLAYSGNKALAQFLAHYRHYLAPQWLQIAHLSGQNAEGYRKKLREKGYGLPPELYLKQGLFDTAFWKNLQKQINA